MAGTSRTFVQNIPLTESTSAAKDSMKPKNPTATPIIQIQEGYAFRVDHARIKAVAL